ncbi:sensor histidine kinase [Tepidimonas taiwanensis]|uniref:histidine kinase n=1 Tax=Tepidimonas taiwanensis TaxID=307486 RepID=A0A554XDC7_9BURK|nr:sensor histidine kinase [Tepidimonas taiwanensis]MCX7693125.1 sensor histidine kinase [Tepidimonas taiwanensis]TSE33836.1 Sensor histidine kinase ResE [Tepidimonas taiwanensis]UBQ06629.1 sensor histidine kinase [Tepidimonas taiwanensis]
MSPVVVLAAAFAYLGGLFAIAHWADRRAQQGRSVIGNAWVYTLSMAVYCTAWTYFGSVGRAASGGLWFLPIYLGPTLALVLGWVVLRKMVRIAHTYRITTIADFIGSRYGKSPALAGAVTLITVVGIVPYIALQLKGIAVASAVVIDGSAAGALHQPWWHDSTLYLALGLAVFTIAFGVRHWDSTERHEGMVAAIAFESLVKLAAFLAVGAFVTWGMFDGWGDLIARAQADPALTRLLTLGDPGAFAWSSWLALTVLAGLSVLLLPRQFQVMVVEAVDERHIRRAAWGFPLYLWLINLFVLPLALAGGLTFGAGSPQAEVFVLRLPQVAGAEALLLLVFLGGLSAATGMVIVESIAVATMVCNDLVLPWWLRRQGRHRAPTDLTRVILRIRRGAILLLLLLGYGYYRLAGDAYALVSIGLISFAAVAQFAPALLGGMVWKGASRAGAMAGLLGGFAVWAYTLMLPSLAKSGWLSAAFVTEGPWGIDWLRPEALFGLQGFDPLTHALFWSALVNVGLYVGVSLARPPGPVETSQALLFVDVFDRTTAEERPVFWRGEASLASLQALLARVLGAERAQALLQEQARARGVALPDLPADAALVHWVETQLAGAVGSASARWLVASVVEEQPLRLEDVFDILRETGRLRALSRALEDKSRSLERATAELRAANERLQELDRLKDDFMSSVTHELRTPLTSIRALTEILRDDPGMDVAQRQQFLDIVVAESERLTRLVNQVLDLAKIESGHADWHVGEVVLQDLVEQAARAAEPLLQARGARLTVEVPDRPVVVRADPDRLQQVLMNLLSNAAKFVPEGCGEVVLRVSMVADARTPMARVEVQDNGPGVPPEEQAVIFEKFRQGRDARERPGGTGLGLPISRRIIEHLGGRLWLRSAPGQGACFGFDVPLAMPYTANDEPSRGDELREQARADRG